MQIYSDYKSIEGVWYTFRPLNVIKREELSTRFNKLSRESSLASQLIEDESGGVEWNVEQMLKLYDLRLDLFEVEEIDEVFVKHILPVNFEKLNYDQDSPAQSLSRGREEEKVEEVLSNLLSSVWGICNSAGDALFMLEKLPAEMLLSTIKKRSTDLENIYATDEDKRKKQAKQMKESMVKSIKKEQKSHEDQTVKKINQIN